MLTLRIEHPIPNYQSWKAAFDSDPAHRRESGVLRYRILRPVDDPNYIIIDLDFENSSQAEVFLANMREVWRTPQAASAFGGSPQARIAEALESKEY